MINLPTTAPTDLFASVGTLMNDLWPLIAILIGIPLAFFIIELIIDMIWPENVEEYSDEELKEAASGVPPKTI